MDILTIGISNYSAQEFFEKIEKSPGNKIIDIRINRNSQLSGFARDRDLDYFLPKLSNVTYEVGPMLAPTKELLKKYRNKEIDWNVYARHYLDLLRERQVENNNMSIYENAILMCSENSPVNCHRRLAAEYLAHRWPNVNIIHL